MKQASKVGVAVYSHLRNEWIFPFTVIEEQKRVRLDVHDGLSNYSVYYIDVENDVSTIASDWEKNLT